MRGLPIKSPVTFGLKGMKPLKERIEHLVRNRWGAAAGPNYTSKVAFDNDGNEIGKWSGGEYQAHFANFIKAVRSRNYKDLHLDIEDGHPSRWGAQFSVMPFRYRLGNARVPEGTRPSLMSENPHVMQTLTTFEDYLREDGVDFSATKFYLGQAADDRPENRAGNRRRREPTVHAANTALVSNCRCRRRRDGRCSGIALRTWRYGRSGSMFSRH